MNRPGPSSRPDPASPDQRSEPDADKENRDGVAEAAGAAEDGQSPLDRLTDELSNLPGIGRKTAEKLAYHLLRATPEEARNLAAAIVDVKENMTACSTCFHLTETTRNPCRICTDADRDRSRLCVVEQPRDLLAIEKTGTYNGLYHVLTGRVSPLEGHLPEDLTLSALRTRIEQSHPATPEDPGESEPITEVILATNPDFEGDGTAHYVREALDGLPVAITQLARGIPQGASIEFVSAAILSDALKGRHATPEPTRTAVTRLPD